ncbi:MAG: hypothetical protein OEQ29_10560 [Alphaproteobacteria bacterium]|nr:hypothetical protein [Alphaproteobacteria bacterium]
MPDSMKISPDVIGLPPGHLPTKPDHLDEEFRADLAQHQIEHLKENNLNLQSTRKLRQSVARAVYWFMVAWSLAVLALLVLAGFKVFGFDLPPAVLAALIGSTTAGVIGMVAFLVKGLFPSAKY